MQFNNWQIPITIVCLISGILLAVQLQIQNVKPTSPNLKNQDLVSLINELESSTSLLEDDLEQLRLEVAEFQDEKANGEVLLKQLQRELTNLKDTTGLTEQSGPGIILTLNDHKAGAEAAKATGLENFYPDDYIIHDKNILYLINELKEAAKAISVNNQRIAANTDIRCVGTVILVNTTRLAPPYEIKAIGDPEFLAEKITTSYEYTYLHSRGFPLKLTKEQELTVAAYRGSYRYSFAEIVKEGDL